MALPLLALALWAATPAKLEDAVNPPPTLHPLIPGTEERITRVAARTEWSIVALHGFSATRQETAPLAELVAAALQANLFEARLSGHGHAEYPMDGVKAEHWLADAQRALQLGAELGDKIIVIGTSTGATLATVMLDQAMAEHIDTLVMISPNFSPRGSGARWLTRPLGPLLVRLVIGEQRCWETPNDLQRKYWSTCYPIATLVEVMRLVDRANRMLPAAIEQRLLMFYARDDKVISTEAALAVFDGTVSPDKEAIEIAAPGDPSHHVLAGDILSPETTQDIADAIVSFVRRPAP